MVKFRQIWSYQCHSIVLKVCPNTKQGNFIDALICCMDCIFHECGRNKQLQLNDTLFAISGGFICTNLDGDPGLIRPKLDGMCSRCSAKHLGSLGDFPKLHESLASYKRQYDAALQQNEMNKWNGPKVKHVWNVVMHVLHILWGLSLTKQFTTWADTAFIFFY